MGTMQVRAKFVICSQPHTSDLPPIDFSHTLHSLSSPFVPPQEPRYKDLSDTFDSGVDGLTADTSSPSQVSSLLWFPGASRAQSSGAIHQTTNDALRQNIYENFMRELETGTRQGGGERRVPSTGTEEDESSSESAEGSLEQLDLLFEKEQGVVRRAGWLSFKPLVTLHKDRKLELVTRRKWKQYWVTLKGELRCPVLETQMKNSQFGLVGNIRRENKIYEVTHSCHFSDSVQDLCFYVSMSQQQLQFC